MDIDEEEFIDNLNAPFHRNNENVNILYLLNNEEIKNSLKDGIQNYQPLTNIQYGGTLDVSQFMKKQKVRYRYISKFKYTGQMFKVIFENLPADIQQLNIIIY